MKTRVIARNSNNCLSCLSQLSQFYAKWYQPETLSGTLRFSLTNRDSEPPTKQYRYSELWYTSLLIVIISTVVFASCATHTNVYRPTVLTLINKRSEFRSNMRLSFIATLLVTLVWLQLGLSTTLKLPTHINKNSFYATRLPSKSHARRQVDTAWVGPS